MPRFNRLNLQFLRLICCMVLCLGSLLLFSARDAVAKHKKINDHKRLKIAFVVDSLSQGKSGGVISAKRFLKELRKHHEVNVVSSDRNQNPYDHETSGFYLPFVKNKMKKNGIKFAYTSHKKLKAVFEASDVVYIHFPFYVGMQAVKVAKKMGKPVVVGFHLQPENLLLNVGIQSQALNRFTYRLFVKHFYNLADFVICPSHFARDLLLEHPQYNKGKEKSVVISNGLIPAFRKSGKRKSLSEKNLKDPFTVLSVGRLAKEKRHDLIIEAIRLSKYSSHIQLVVTGDGVLKQKLIALGSSLPLPPKFGFVSKNKLKRLYRSADLYVHASEIELEGMSVLEAIGGGCPAIISDSQTSASKQFAIWEREFLFDHHSAESLSERIDYWYENRERLELASKAYAKSAKKYYIERSVKAMLRTFQKAIKLTSK